MKKEWPSPEVIEMNHEKRTLALAEATARIFRDEVRVKLLNSTGWPVIIEEAAYLTLSNPILKEVEQELTEAGYATSITNEGMLKIERKKE